MKNKIYFGIVFVLGITILFLSSCQDNVFNPQSESEGALITAPGTKAVFVQTNQSAGNEVRVYSRMPDGNISFLNSYPTQGTGTGMGLGSQGALAFARGGSILLVVNAGSNEISVFKSAGAGLLFRSKISSGGTMPISVTSQGNLVYVLNAGGSGNITGFYLTAQGDLNPIPNSTRFLSNNGVGTSPGPAQVSFNTGGSVVVVTEKATNKILSYTVNGDGTLNGPNVFSSAGVTPFGFSFRGDEQIIVSEAFGGAVDSSAVSSYSVGSGGNISLISGPVFTTETAACWIVVTNNLKYTYTSNTGSGTITGYSINPAGELTILDADGVTANIGTGTAPIDMALSTDSRYLYCLNSGSHTISSLRVNGNGSLTAINLSSVTGLPDGAWGLLAK
jgi:6-phosphogluconolactonase